MRDRMDSGDIAYISVGVGLLSGVLLYLTTLYLSGVQDIVLPLVNLTADQWQGLDGWKICIVVAIGVMSLCALGLWLLRAALDAG